MSISDGTRRNYKQALRRACENYIIEHDAGGNAYAEFTRIKSLVRKLDGNWRSRRRPPREG
jgi:hypothetical protein